MRIAILLCLLLAGCDGSPTFPNIRGMRDGFIEINNSTRLAFNSCGLSAPFEVNVGEKPDDGTGDVMATALNKVAANFRILRESSCVKKGIETPARQESNTIEYQGSGTISIPPAQKVRDCLKKGGEMHGDKSGDIWCQEPPKSKPRREEHPEFCEVPDPRKPTRTMIAAPCTAVWGKRPSAIPYPWDSMSMCSGGGMPVCLSPDYHVAECPYGGQMCVPN